MKPFDPRLLRHVASVRTALLLISLLTVLSTIAVVTQSVLLARVIVSVFQQGATLADLKVQALGLFVAFLMRAVLSWAIEVVAARAAINVKSTLRELLTKKILALGPIWLNTKRANEVVLLSTRGVDALDNYFSRFIPSLVAATILPMSASLVILLNDRLSFVIVILTVPLIPFFMILIGWATSARVESQWRTLSSLSIHFADLVAGLPTLKVFGRAASQLEKLKASSIQYTQATMSVLRLSFISAFALELIATLSVALIAVSIGLRLVEGQLSLSTGLTALILAPEIYTPIRQVGLNFHAASDGVEAADKVFAILEISEIASASEFSESRLSSGDLEFRGVSARYPEQSTRVLDDVSFTARSGEITALVGSSGSGKSTLLNVLLGFLPIESGSILLDGKDLEGFSAEQIRDQISFLAQRPWLANSTLKRAIDPLGKHDDAELATICARVGLTKAAGLPDGLATFLGANGTALSHGQFRRVAIARALIDKRPIVVLDEPTAALDGLTEDLIIEALVELRDAGATVLVVAHHPKLISVADHVVNLSGGKVSANV